MEVFKTWKNFCGFLVVIAVCAIGTAVVDVCTGYEPSWPPSLREAALLVSAVIITSYVFYCKDKKVTDG